MAVTLLEDTPSHVLRTALERLRPDGATAARVREELAERLEAQLARDEDGSDAYVRHLELAGYDEARYQERMEAQLGIPM
jgi:hypothetical protein